MAKVEIQLAALIAEELHGDIVAKVLKTILDKGKLPLRLIQDASLLSLKQVKKCLQILINHNLVTFDIHAKGFVEYCANCDTVLSRFRFSRYVYFAKTLYGDVGELLVEELLYMGRATMNTLIKTVHEKLSTEEQLADLTIPDVKKKFESLVLTCFVMRCLEVDEAVERNMVAPIFLDDEARRFSLSSTASASVKSEPPKKRRRIESDDEDDAADDVILWQVNTEKFDYFWRDQCLVQAICHKVDAKSGEILRTLLRLSEVNTHPNQHVSNPVSIHDILRGLPKEFNFVQRSLEQHLNVMVKDATNIVVKAGESGGGMFSIDYRRGFTAVCRAHVESVVQERFGSKALRIFNFLSLKQQAEQEQVQSGAMIPSKEAKELLYLLHQESFVTVTEVAKTPDHAPSRTFYLFSVDLPSVVRTILRRCYVTAFNLTTKRRAIVEANRRLLDKQTRIQAIVASLENPSDEEKQEIEDMISPTEKNVLDKVKKQTDRLEGAELQLTETIFILEIYMKNYSRAVPNKTS